MNYKLPGWPPFPRYETSPIPANAEIRTDKISEGEIRTDKVSEGEIVGSINPKDAIGSDKLPLHLWPVEATAVGCLGMLEGRCKYGRNNFIAGDGVIASIYIDAMERHLAEYKSGQNIDPVSGKPTLAGILASCAILVKAEAHGKLIDDRDYSAKPDAYHSLVERLTPIVSHIKSIFKDKKPRHYTIKDVK